MKDKDLINLLKQDHSHPPRRSGEWAKLVDKIELDERKYLFFSNIFTQVTFAALLLIFSVGVPLSLWEQNSQAQVGINEYYFEENYFELDDAYHWAEKV